MSETKKYIEKFEDLDVWKESMQLTMDIYGICKDLRDFGFRDQIQRSAVSIPSNIAEGFERHSNKEFIQYLYVAKGSCGELRTQLYLAGKLMGLPIELADSLLEKTRKISAMLSRLIEVRKQRF